MNELSWLTPESDLTDLPRFQAYVRERGQFLLEELDDWLSKLEPPDENGQEPMIDTGVGIYHYLKKEDDD